MIHTCQDLTFYVTMIDSPAAPRGFQISSIRPSDRPPRAPPALHLVPNPTPPALEQKINRVSYHTRFAICVRDFERRLKGSEERALTGPDRHTELAHREQTTQACHACVSNISAMDMQAVLTH